MKYVFFVCIRFFDHLKPKTIPYFSCGKAFARCNAAASARTSIEKALTKEFPAFTIPITQSI